MRVIHLCRKPLEGSVAKTALKYGTGGLNIDDSRVGTAADLAHSNRTGHSLKESPVHVFGPQRMHAEPSGLGRWPANVIFQHLPGCRCVGTRRVSTGTATPKANGFRTEYVAGTKKSEGFGGGFAEDDGKETVPLWECAEGCPVKDLDDQSGIQKSGVAVQRNRDGLHLKSDKGWGMKAERKEDEGFGDTGGASRFFKQVQGNEVKP